MSIFHTPAPRKVGPGGQSVTRWSDKTDAANVKGDREGAPRPERDIKHAPNAGSKT